MEDITEWERGGVMRLPGEVLPLTSNHFKGNQAVEAPKPPPRNMRALQQFTIKYCFHYVLHKTFISFSVMQIWIG